eukprot:scaffold724_cov264-Chaetoceros_neogracile.AAC.11
MRFLLSAISACSIMLGLQSSNIIYASAADEGFEITNEDAFINVAIDPPIRISLFATSEQLTDSGVNAFLNAASDYATERMQVYFDLNYGNQYDFESVQFEAIIVEPLVSGRRNLRVFEREETNLVNSENLLGNDGHSAFNRIMKVREVENDQNRDLLVEYGTAFTLVGNFTFGAIPAAPSRECNRKLGKHMMNYWPFLQMIKSQNNTELNPRDTNPLLTEILTPEPTPSPTKAPSKAPSPSPTSIPATAVPSENPSESHFPFYTPRPTQDLSSSPSKAPFAFIEKGNPNGITGGSDNIGLKVGVSVGSSIAFIAVVVALYMNHNKRARMRNPGLLNHKSFDSGNSDLDVDDGSPKQLRAGSTKDIESGESGSFNDSADSSNGVPLARSIATNETMKAGNVLEAPKKVLQTWLKSSPAKSVGKGSYKETPTKEPEHEVLPFPVKLSDSVSSHSSASPFDDIDDADAASPVTTELSSPQRIQPDEEITSNKAPLETLQSSPVVKSLFGKGSNQGTPSSASRRLNSISDKGTPGSASRKLNASTVVTVTPTKVSKEEFDQEWDADLPFNWNPAPAKSEKKRPKKKKQKDASKSDGDIDIEGSFPIFDIVDDPLIRPLRRGPSRANSSTLDSSLGTTMHSVSSANQSANDMHPMDWSDKGSSVGDSTFTDGDGTGKDPSQDFQWKGKVSPYPIDAAYRSESKNNLTPNSASSRKSLGSLGSSPSSKGSSKQLIHDIVWLEKKIKDVRARVDRLDGDESHTTGSLPISPMASETMNRSIGSPESSGSSISANIICRDVFAPPGKLQIIIRSTKDGPAILHVKPRSVLNGQIFAGDLIVSVNDVDTRAYDAEDVMELMAQSSTSDRKITVLHAV